MIDYSAETLNTTKKRNPRFDFILFFAVLALSGFGLLIIYSATRYSLPGGVSDPAYFLKRQAYSFGVGMLMFIVMLFLDYRKLKRWWPLIFISAAVLLISPLLIGFEVHYTKSWINLGFTTIQPSEIAKIFMVVSVAAIFSKWKGEKENKVGIKKVALSLLVAVVCVSLVVLQSDFGTSLVFFFTYMGMLFISGANLLYFLSFLGASTGLVFLGIRTGLIMEYQLNRILVFLRPDTQIGDIGYNLYQSKLAIGSGGLWGQGLFLGRQTNLSYVPEHQTDFIFSVIGEELGFIGCFIVVIVLGVVIWRCFSIAYQATDHFGTMIASGLAFIMLSQMVINMGMTIGIMPIIGIPLPFLSYGGSSLVGLLMGLSLVEGVYMRREVRKYHQIAYEEFD